MSVASCLVISKLCVAFPNLKYFLSPAVSTYNTKEALTGIYGVQQLIHMVLNEEQRGVKKKENRQTYTKNQHSKWVQFWHIIKFIDSCSQIIMTHLHIFFNIMIEVISILQILKMLWRGCDPHHRNIQMWREVEQTVESQLANYIGYLEGINYFPICQNKPLYM